jgi:hypothetical protein
LNVAALGEVVDFNAEAVALILSFLDPEELTESSPLVTTTKNDEYWISALQRVRDQVNSSDEDEDDEDEDEDEDD